MKNITTPRTLAECQFTTGYRSAALPRRFGWADIARGVVCLGVVCLGVFALIGVLLAWRV